MTTLTNKEEKFSIDLNDQSQNLSRRQEISSATINIPIVPIMKEKSRITSRLSSTSLNNILKFSYPVSPTIKNHKKAKQRKSHRTPILRPNPRQVSNTSVSQHDKSLLDFPQLKHALFALQETSKEVKIQENSIIVEKADVSLPLMIKESRDSLTRKSSKDQKEKKIKEKNFKEKETKEIIEGEKESQINHILEILKKSPEVRTEDDLEKLAVQVADIAFFKDLETKHGRPRLLKCLSKLTHSEISRNKVVFRQGDIGTTYYIILRGRVKVTKETWVKVEQDVNEQHGDLKQNNAEPMKNLIDSTSQKKPLTLMLVSSDVAELHVGQCFGEIALLTKKPRGATVTAVEDCEFAVLEKSDFDKILSDYEEKILAEKLTFLNSINLFSGWNYNLISKLYFHLRQQRFVFNNMIYKEGNKANRMYIVKKGELTVYRRIKLSETEKLHKMHLLSQKTLFKDVAIAVVGPMELLGEEDILSTGIYTSTVVCTSAEAEVLSMTKKDFMHHVWSEEGAKFYLKNLIDIKLNNYEDRTREIQSKWTNNKGFLYSLNQNGLIQLTKRASQPDEVFHRLEQFYQGPQETDKSRAKFVSNSEEPFDLDTQTKNNAISQIGLPLIKPLQTEPSNILSLLEAQKSSQSPSCRRDTTLKDIVLIPRFSSQLKQVSYDSPAEKHPTDWPQKSSQEARNSNKQLLTQVTLADLSLLHDLSRVQNAWPENISPIRSPNRSLVLSEGPKDSPSFFKPLKEYELSPEDDKFSLEGRSRGGSLSNALRVIEIYKKGGKIQDDRGSLPLLKGPPDMRKDSITKLPLKLGKNEDRETLRSTSIPRIRVDARNALMYGITQSQILERRSVGSLEGGSLTQEINHTTGEGITSNTIIQNETCRQIRTEIESIEDRNYGLHPKVQMLSSLKTKLRVGIIQYQGLKKHLEGPDEMERNNISRNMIMKQLDDNKQNMKLVYGTKLFSNLKKEVTKRFYENKRRKEKIMQPNMMNDMIRAYLKTMVTDPETGESPNNTEGTERVKQATSRKVENVQKAVERSNMQKLEHRSSLEYPAQIKKTRSQSSFLMRQKNYKKEVEQEMLRVSRKIHGVGVVKSVQEKEDLREGRSEVKI